MERLLDIGVGTLAVQLDGDLTEEHGYFVDTLLGAFVGPNADPTRPTLTARWTAEAGMTVTTLASDAARAPQPISLGHGHQYVEWQFYRGCFGPDGAYGVFTARQAGLQHVLRATTVLACQPARALFFHAATLVYDGVALLVAGHPNAGKSTISREGGADWVLSNEISIIERRADGWWALPSPFWGTGDIAHRTQAARLGGIAVLSQSPDRNRWAPLVGARALAALVPHGGHQLAADFRQTRVLEPLTALVTSLPVYSFAWYRPSHPLEHAPWKPSR